jgi:hypothetical protein
MKRLLLTMTVATVLAAPPFGCGRGVDRANLQARAASSLAEQFESVVYSKPEFVSAWDTNNPLPKDPAANLRNPFRYLWSALDSLPAKAASALLANSEAVLMGAKNFRAPTGLGDVRSQRCYVVVLKSGNSFDLQNHTHTAGMTSPSGLRIWNWSATLGEFGDGLPDKFEVRDQLSTLYATQIKQSYLLVSNDLKVLEALAQRLTSSNGNSQGVVGFHDWGELLQHEMWGYRRYRLSDTHNKMAAGVEDVPARADGLVFFLEAQHQIVAVRLILKDPSAESAAAAMYSRYQLPSPTPAGEGVWETRIRLSDTKESFAQTFGIIGLFGFAVYS